MADVAAVIAVPSEYVLAPQRPTSGSGIPNDSVRSESPPAPSNDEKGAKKIYSKDILLGFQEANRDRPTDMQVPEELMRSISQSRRDNSPQRRPIGVDLSQEISLRPGVNKPYGGGLLGLGPSMSRLPLPRPASDRPPSSGGNNNNMRSQPPRPSSSDSGTLDWRASARTPSSEQQQRVSPSPTASLSFPLLEPLGKSENAWRPVKVVAEDEKIVKNIRSILNKLTPEKFDTLLSQILDAGITNVNIEHRILDLIFDKAVSEPMFSSMYAQLCVCISDRVKPFPDPTDPTKELTFKRILLNKCQEEFEGEHNAKALENTAAEELVIAQNKIRKRLMGTVTLIAELLKKKMLPEKIIHQCLTSLLGKRESPDPVGIEALCKLMASVGKTLDHPKAKDYMEQYFGRLRDLSMNEKLDSRMRFMIKDVIDLRLDNWVPRRKLEQQKTIEEVHKEAMMEEMEKSMALRAPLIFTPGGAPPPLLSQRGNGPSPGPPATMLSSGGSQGMPRSASVEFNNKETQRSSGVSPLTVVPRPSSVTWASNPPRTITPPPPAQRTSAVMNLLRTPIAANASGPSPTSTNLSTGPGPRSTSPQVPVAAASAWGAGARAPTIIRSPQVPSSFRPVVAPASDLASSPPVVAPPAVRPVATTTTTTTANPEPSPPPALSKTPLTDDQLRENLERILTEYWASHDVKEATLNLKQWFAGADGGNSHAILVHTTVRASLEKKDKERELCVQVLDQLCRDKILLSSAVITGMQQVCGDLEDLVFDVPKAYETSGWWLSEFARMGALSSQDITTVLVSVTPPEKVSAVRSEIKDIAI